MGQHLRSRFIPLGCAVLLVLGLLLWPVSSVAPVAAGNPATVQLVAQPFLSGLNLPIYLAPAGDGTGRLFVVEQQGRIQLIKNGVKQPTPFLDISSRVAYFAGQERGLYSIAFSPTYVTDGYFYVNYARQSTDPSQLGDIILARYHVSANPDSGDSASEQILLVVPHHTYSNHNGGTVAFGPDGYLYLSIGDGGNGGDPNGNGQNTQVLLGKMLRLDVSGAGGYTIPPTNPFTGPNAGAGAPEVWAYGLRNPWRYSFDPPGGMLFIGDVGQNLYEEVDAVPLGAAGLNYGWNTTEGFHCYHPATNCATAGITLPVQEYPHIDANGVATGDCAITGGFVYRGTRYPSLVGLYLYADYCSGRIWALDQPSPGVWRNTLLLDTPYLINSFGKDESGELYITTLGSGTGSNSVFHLADTAVAYSPLPHVAAPTVVAASPKPAPPATAHPMPATTPGNPTPLPLPSRR